MRISELVKELECIGVEDPKTEAQLIIENLFGVSYAKALLERDRDYDSEKILEILAKRKEKIPLQYIFGKWGFMGLDFFVSPDCLIPRPDTEILVYEAQGLLKIGGSVADLCTGSGCIGLSLLSTRADIERLVMADISRGALEMARKNAHALGLSSKCTLVECDVTRSIPEGRFDMIVSNPPYIPSTDIEQLSDEVKNEPRLALDGGEDGLDIVRSLVERVPEHLNENGYFLMEFGFDQGEKIAHIMEKKVTDGVYKSYKILKDYGGNDRVLVAQA